MGIRAYDGFGLRASFRHGQILGRGDQGTDVIRRCAATAAEQGGTHLCKFCRLLCKIFCGKREAGLPVLHKRKSRIGLNDQWQGSVLGKFGNDRKHLVRPKGTVAPDRIHGKPLQKCNHGKWIGTGHQLSALVINVRNNDRKIAVFLCRKNGGFGFVSIVHRFDDDEIRTCFCTDANALCENFDRILKIQRAVGLEQLSRRPDIQCNVSSKRNCRSARICDGGLDQCGIVFVFFSIDTEGVCRDHVTACLGIRAVNILDHLRVGKVPKHRRRSRGEATALYHCAKAAVEIQAFFADGLS